ncbi:MAG: hypothetical protein ACLSBB_06530 [Ruthenibacterium lactatiformans]
MAIITTLVGLGVLLVFTVLGCVLEVFWPGGRAYGRDWPCLSSPACMRW